MFNRINHLADESRLIYPKTVNHPIKPETLLIVGDSESTNPGIQRQTINILGRVLNSSATLVTAQILEAV